MLQPQSDDHLDPTGEINLDVVKKRAIKGALFLTSRTFLLQLISLLATFLLTVFLSPADYGIFFIVSAVVNFFVYFSDIGLAPALIQKKEKITERDLCTTFTIQQLLVICLIVIIFIATPLFENIYRLERDGVYLLWALLLSLFFSSLKTIPSVLLERRLDFGKLVIPQIVESLVFNISVVLLAWRGFGVNSFTIAVLARGIIGVILLYIIQPWKPKFMVSKESFNHLFKFGLPYQGNTLLAMIKDDGMTAFLGGILGPGGLGLLGWAQKWAAAPLRFFMDQVIKVTFPAFSRMQDNRNELSNALSKSIFFISLVVFPMIAVLIVCAPIVTEIVPKYDKWKPALLALGLLSINTVLAAVTTPITNLFNAIGKITLTSKLMIMWTVLSWVFIPMLAYKFGVTGAAAGFALVSSSSIVALVISRKYVSIDFWSSFGKPLIAGVFMLFAMYMVSSFMQASFIELLLVVVTGFITYVLFVFLLVGKSLIVSIKTLLQSALVILFFLLALSFPKFVSAQSYVSVVNPVRGSEFWDSSESPADAVRNQIIAVKESSLPATWLLRIDALNDDQILGELKDKSRLFEYGIFFEVTPLLASKSGVNYHKTESWHLAYSVFLSGYQPEERKKMIDSVFSDFKLVFGNYPKSVGAWWIDSYSLGYMQEKYGITAALMVADQYSTDNYQIWGQYWGAPYYPYKLNALFPARERKDKIPVVITQWAARDPLNGYGNGVFESTYSVQANDYTDFHDLDITYFNKLVDIYTKQKFNKINHLVVGLENSYSGGKHQGEYRKQIQSLSNKQKESQLKIVNMSDFADIYSKTYPGVSPEHILVAEDPLGTDQKVIWYMNPYYRAGWFYDKRYGSVFRDIRQYVDGQMEPCFNTACTHINFATFATRVLDEVTYGQKLVIDPGKVEDVKVEKSDQGYRIKYRSEFGLASEIGLMERDLVINGKIATIDGVILQALTQDLAQQKSIETNPSLFLKYKEDTLSVVRLLGTSFLFLIFVLIIPGFLFARVIQKASFAEKIFISVVVGMVCISLLYYVLTYLGLNWFIYIYIAIASVALARLIPLKNWPDLAKKRFHLKLIIVILTILGGTFFQSLAMVRSGWVYDYGIGFLGPTGHDIIWHQSVVNQLLKQVPPESPILSKTALKNYHYFYNILIAASSKLSGLPVIDLLYRFYPVLFSLLLGLGSYVLTKRLFNNYLASIFTLFFVYFGGSLGYVVEFVKRKSLLGGESAFWVNQPVSFNLNPPFAISMIILIALLLVLVIYQTQKQKSLFALAVVLAGSLIVFKSYAGVLTLICLGLVGVYKLLRHKDLVFIKLTLVSSILGLLLFLPLMQNAGNFFELSPFWFVHSMIDFADRVGWERLSIARFAYIERGEWAKFVLLEGLTLAIFLLGNFGSRVVGIFGLKSMPRSEELRSIYMFIGFVFIMAILLPMIFIQKGNPWNTIQFLYYALYLSSLFAGLGLASVYQKLPQVFGMALIGLVVVLTPISSIATFLGGLGKTVPATLTLGELEGLQFLENKSDGVVLTYPFDATIRAKYSSPYPISVYETSAYVSAFTGKPSFMEDIIQQEIFQSDYKKRLASSKEFFKGRDAKWSAQFLEQNGIKYIYVPKLHNLNLDTNELPVRKIFENKEVDIYAVVNIDS